MLLKLHFKEESYLTHHRKSFNCSTVQMIKKSCPEFANTIIKNICRYLISCMPALAFYSNQIFTDNREIGNWVEKNIDVGGLGN